MIGFLSPLDDHDVYFRRTSVPSDANERIQTKAKRLPQLSQMPRNWLDRSEFESSSHFNTFGTT